MSASDLGGELATFQIVNPIMLDVTSGTKTYAGVDIREYIGEVIAAIQFRCHHELPTNNTVVSILDSADNVTFESNAANAPITTTVSTSLIELSIDTRKYRRYIQGKIEISGTTQTVEYAVVGVGKKKQT